MALVHFAKWKKGKRFSPHTLLLDPDNYRFDNAGTNLSQSQIRELLVADQKVRELAKTIVTKGYIPVEDIVLIHADGKYIVAEGNRRVCAFQLLAKPDLAPPNARAAFRRLRERAGDELPTKLECVIAPNRSEADIYVFAKHADDGFRKAWARPRQAAFVVARLNSGSSVADVAEQTGLEPSKIVESVVAVELLRLVDCVPLDEATRERLADPDSFNYTALVERIFGNPEIRAILGIEIDASGIRGVAGNREGFLTVLTKIFEDVAGSAATRVYATSELATARVKSFGYQAEGKSEWRAFIPKESGFTPVVPTSAQGKKPKKAAAGPGKSAPSGDFVLPFDLSVEVGTPKLRALIDEAQRIEIDRFPHIAGFALRCVFEIALNEAVDERNCRKALLALHPGSKNAELSVRTLLIEAKKGQAFSLNLDQPEKRIVDTLTGNGFLSYDTLNLIAHNKHWAATASNVRALRDSLLPILRKALSGVSP